MIENGPILEYWSVNLGSHLTQGLMSSFQDSPRLTLAGAPRPTFAEAHFDLGCNIPVLRT
jgi:hypothetical protein